MRRRLVTVGAAVALLVALPFAVACGGGEETATTAAPAETTAATGPATGEPIKIGVVTSMSGGAAVPTQSMLNALDLEIGLLNSNGGVNGRPIELILMDDKTDAATAVSAATKLITQDKVTAILGPLHTPCALAVQPLAERYEVPLLRWDTPTLDAPAVDEHWSFICSVGPEDVADALTKQIEAEGWTNILAAADALPPNFQAIELLTQTLPDKGVEITALTDNWQLDITDMTPMVNKIYAAYKEVQPEVLFLMSSIHHTPIFVQKLRALGVTCPIQSGAVSGHPTVFMKGPEVVEGLLLIGAGITNPVDLPDDFPYKAEMVEFGARFEAAYDEAVTLFAGAAYDSFYILLEGLKAGVDDRAKIRDAIEALQDFPVTQGVVNYGPDDHQLHGGYNEWVVESGEFKFVRTLN
ncbi:MAG: ABC transporter substrate-binding protein [Thermoleophilia bacterium]|nr:ABC transporter substrate-binding protein [Thermoleophilia bacterium]